MPKYKVCVYAICKDEAKFAARWMASMAEADAVYVLDTGSRDGTPELLRALGTWVAEERIAPWPFDTARNRALQLVPQDADICVCTDLDETFAPAMARAALHYAPEDARIRRNLTLMQKGVQQGNEPPAPC
jgi:hypothetical protein